ncbi:hypothetical protein B566_EDAN016337 [Ephemera danica]|nr:hypothetical protein B566_EDAN016337 [Ephemera danica]
MANEDVVMEEVGEEPLPDLSELAVKRSKKTHLLTLKTLCLQSIVKSLQSVWVKIYQRYRDDRQMLSWTTTRIVGPFEDLPGSLITDILTTLRSIGVCHPRHFRLLITSNTEVLDLSGLSKGANLLLSALLDHCKQCGCIKMPILINSLSHFKNLKILNLKRLGIVDAVLETIGSVMTDLRELYLCHNHVTNTGLSRLCVDDGRHGKCKELRVLTLESNEVNVDGLVLALTSFPKLRVLDSFDLCSAVLRWRQENPNRILSLQILSVTMNELSSENVEHLLDICPAITTLIFLPTDNQVQYDLSPFLQATNLTKDELLCHLAEVVKFDNKILEQLESLELWFCESVTIKGILALICLAPSLKHLGLIRCPNVTRANFLKMKKHCVANNLGLDMIWK